MCPLSLKRRRLSWRTCGSRIPISRDCSLVPDKDKELANIAVAVDQLNTALRRVNLLLATQAPRLEGTLENFRKISADLKDLSADLKRTPSDLLFSAPPRKSELLK